MLQLAKAHHVPRKPFYRGSLESKIPAARLASKKRGYSDSMSTRQVVALGGAAFGALLALNGALSRTPPPPLKSTMPGDSRRFAWDEGAIHYVVTGAGSPLVLVHGLGVAASSFEFRYVVELFARTHTVYAPDLLGFGLSDHPDLAYSGSTYIRLLSDFLEHEVRAPAVLIGCGLSALYCIAVAARRPNAVAAAALCMPSFPDGRPDLPVPMRAAVDGVLSAPLVGQSLFRLMTARNAIRSYLRERAYSNPDLVTESMVDAQYAMAHQPNALLAPHAYLAGRLGVDVSHELASLAKPVLVVAGSNTNPSPRPWLAHYVRLCPHARVAMIASCGALPHEEQPEQFVNAIRAWIELH